MITAAWIIGLVMAAMGWLFSWLAFFAGAITLGLGWILFFVPLVGIILSIIGLANAEANTREKTLSLQALLMCITGPIIGWFAFFFLLIKLHRN